MESGGFCDIGRDQCLLALAASDGIQSRPGYHHLSMDKRAHNGVDSSHALRQIAKRMLPDTDEQFKECYWCGSNDWCTQVPTKQDTGWSWMCEPCRAYA